MVAIVQLHEVGIDGKSYTETYTFFSMWGEHNVYSIIIVL